MKRGFLIGVLTIVLIFMLVGFTKDETVEQPKATATPLAATPELVVFELVPISTPAPIPTPEPGEIEIKEYSLNEKDVEIVARLLWSSPLRDRTVKAAFVWVICNRVDSPDFPSTIQSNIKKSEFDYYDDHAYISPENLEIARLVLNQWLSERDGRNAGRLVPKNGLFISYTGNNNCSIDILYEKPKKNEEPKKVYWPMAGAYEY